MIIHVIIVDWKFLFQLCKDWLNKNEFVVSHRYFSDQFTAWSNDGTDDEEEDHEEDEIEYVFEKNNEKNLSDTTLTSFVPSIDVHIENFNETLFTPTFLNGTNQIDSSFIEGVQDFEEYAQSLVANGAHTNLTILYDMILLSYQPLLCDSIHLRLQLVNLIWWDLKLLRYQLLKSSLKDLSLIF